MASYTIAILTGIAHQLRDRPGGGGGVPFRFVISSASRSHVATDNYVQNYGVCQACPPGQSRGRDSWVAVPARCFAAAVSSLTRQSACLSFTGVRRTENKRIFSSSLPAANPVARTIPSPAKRPLFRGGGVLTASLGHRGPVSFNRRSGGPKKRVFVLLTSCECRRSEQPRSPVQAALFRGGGR